MSDSILTSIKKNLGIEEDYTAFDPDITMYINGALATLNQLGIGPENGFRIEDKDATWVEFLGSDYRLNNVKDYVSLRTRMLFDPPTTSYHITAMEKQIEELAWRITTYRDETAWTPPVSEDVFIPSVLDGGDA